MSELLRAVSSATATEADAQRLVDNTPPKRWDEELVPRICFDRNYRAYNAALARVPVNRTREEWITRLCEWAEYLFTRQHTLSGKRRSAAELDDDLFAVLLVAGACAHSEA